LDELDGRLGVAGYLKYDSAIILWLYTLPFSEKQSAAGRGYHAVGGALGV
jgi:hypothetical protein